MRQRLTSVLFVSLLLLTMTTQAVAQPDPGQGTFDIDIVGSVDDALQPMPWDLTIESYTAIFLWVILPILGLFGLFYFLTHTGFRFAEDNLRSSSMNVGSRGELSDVGSLAAKLIALLMSVIAYWYYGWLFQQLLGIAALFGILLIFYLVFAAITGSVSPKPFKGAISGLSNMVGDQQNPPSDGIGGAHNNRSHLDTRNIRDEEDDAERHEGAAEKDTERAEKDHQKGDDEKADKEARSAADHIEKAIQDLELAEEDIQDVLTKDYKELNQTLSELNQTLEESKKDQELIQKSVRFPGKVKKRMEEIRKSVNSGDMKEFEDISNLDLRYLGYGDKGETVIELNDESEQLQRLLSKLSDNFSRELEEEKEEEVEISNEINGLKEAHKLIQKLKKDINIAEKEDKELEKLATDLKDKKLMEEINYEENQEKELINHLKQLQSEEEKIEEGLKEADKILSEIMKFDKEEMEELHEEGKMVGDAITEIKKFEKMVENNIGSNRKIKYEPDNINSEIGSVLESLKGNLGTIRNEVSRLQELKSKDEKEAEKIKKYVDNALGAMN